MHSGRKSVQYICTGGAKHGSGTHRGAHPHPAQNKQLTQRQLADAIGVSDKAVSKWERGCGTPDAGHRLAAELSDGEWYLTSDHPMRREHYLSFAALVNEDTVVLRRLYPEWGAQTRLPYFAHGTPLWYCTRHGLFAQKIDAHKK